MSLDSRCSELFTSIYRTFYVDIFILNYGMFSSVVSLGPAVIRNDLVIFIGLYCSKLYSRLCVVLNSITDLHTSKPVFMPQCLSVLLCFEVGMFSYGATILAFKLKVGEMYIWC